VIRYLVDSSALWRIMREEGVRAAWGDVIADGAIGSCQPQRAEFRRSARNLDEYERMSGMFDDLYADAPVPKSAWRWIEAAQHRLVRSGQHRALSVADLLIAATAVHHRLALVHDDGDFTAAALCLDELVEQNVRDAPAPVPA
jgi:predicted nucleic acid-binding protein